MWDTPEPRLGEAGRPVEAGREEESEAEEGQREAGVTERVKWERRDSGARSFPAVALGQREVRAGIEEAAGNERARKMKRGMEGQRGAQELLALAVFREEMLE